MQRDAIEIGAVRAEDSLLAHFCARFGAKLVVDVLPAVLASVLGGMLITQYQLSRAPVRSVAAQPAPASAEMLQLVRDEHAMIVDYIKAQTAAEKNRNAAEDEANAKAASEAAAEAQAAAIVPAAPAASAAAPAHNDVVAAAKPSAPAAPRIKLMAAVPLRPVAPQAPLVVAQADANAVAQPMPASAPESKSLLAKTLEIKDNIQDHVVHATVGVVSAIGSIPSWIVDRIGGGTSPSDDRSFTS